MTTDPIPAVKPIGVFGLRVGNSKEQRFLSEGSPSLSWKISSDENNVRMSHYQIEIARDVDFSEMHFSSGVRVGDSSRNIEWPALPLLSRQRVFIRVKACSGGVWSPWSVPLECETSLLLRSDWLGAFIAPPNDLGSQGPSPLPFLEKTFHVKDLSGRARFYATARGLYDVKINGQALTEDLFNPGWTDYRFELPTNAYDVTDLLIPGNNTISVLLGDGWYRGMMGWEAKRNTYGDQVSFLCQLEYQDIEGDKTLISDSSWRTKTGRYRFADIYEGVKVDFRSEKNQFPDSPNLISNWEFCVEVDFPEVDLIPSSIPPIGVIEEILPISYSRNGEDTYIFDFGRNITGWISFEVTGNRGDSITVRHAEVLDSEGALYTRNLRRAKATDTYILGDSQKHLLEPIFTYHGFQFAEIVGALEPLNVRAKVVHSAIEATVTLETSNTLLNSLVRNIQHSQTGNFFSVPMDCPQRDERLGWTGDIQSFSKTAVLLYDCEKFLSSWLRQLTHSQLPNGAVTNVVPNVLDSYFDHPDAASGLAGWGDAATMVPWSLYIAYSDKETLFRQIPSMEKWVAYLESRCDESGLLHDKTNQIGDWLDPDAIEGQPDSGKVDTVFVMNDFFSYSTRIIS